MNKNVYNVAFDFGASSGRAILSKFDGEKIELNEIYRFSNDPVKIGDDFYWDFPRLFHELKKGLKKVSKMGIELSGIGIDTWGVDYGLLDANGKLIGIPYHYRDERTVDMIDKVKNSVSFDRIYDITGIKAMDFNTLFQLYADKTLRQDIFKSVHKMLFMPDLFAYFLTGNSFSEYSIASTSQLIDAKTKDWSFELIKELELPENIFQKIIMPGSIYGTLTKEIQEECGLGAVRVVAVGSHDTASAVAGTPFVDGNKVFLSCGTWSLLGMECSKPVVNEQSKENSFTNEGGVENTIRLLKNINGTFILQQLRKSWQQNVQDISFMDIIEAAKKHKNEKFIIDPNDKCFMNPLNMSDAIKIYCEQRGQGKPEDIGELAIAVYNGLTAEYRTVIEKLERVTNTQIKCINMIGGGIQDEFLCQLTANTTGKLIITGPIEASAFGNIIVQLMASADIETINQGRKLIQNSVKLTTYEPE